MSNRTDSNLVKIDPIKIDIPNAKPRKPLMARVVAHAYRPSDIPHHLRASSGTNPTYAYIAATDDEEIREYFPPFVVTQDIRERVEAMVNAGMAQLIEGDS